MVTAGYEREISQMKVLLVHNSYQQPGGEDIVFEQERQLLTREGHTVITYQRSNNDINDYSVLKRLDLLKTVVWATEPRLQLIQLLNREKPDLVHVHNTFLLISPSIYSACQEVGVPVVQTLHNYRLFCPTATFFRDGHVCEECVDHDLSRSIAHGCYRHSRAATAAVVLMLSVHRQRHTWTEGVNSYIALTEFARDRFLEGGLPADKLFVKPNFVHPDPGLPAETRGSYALFVGRLSPEKRVSTVLAAWTHIRSRMPLLVLGGGPERVELEKEALQRGLSGVTFHGQLSREQTLAAMRQARFLVFSSEWYENFPVTLAESFASGLPVICSRLGAMEEIVEDGRTGLHFTPGDSNDLAQKVDWAWSHPERMQMMGKEARREYEAKYTAEKNYPILMNIYEEAKRNNLTLGEFSRDREVSRTT
jgi:glycosyltransferase involved in cell wall biosynthesis